MEQSLWPIRRRGSTSSAECDEWSCMSVLFLETKTCGRYLRPLAAIQNSATSPLSLGCGNAKVTQGMLLSPSSASNSPPVAWRDKFHRPGECSKLTCYSVSSQYSRKNWTPNGAWIDVWMDGWLQPVRCHWGWSRNIVNLQTDNDWFLVTVFINEVL